MAIAIGRFVKGEKMLEFEEKKDFIIDKISTNTFNMEISEEFLNALNRFTSKHTIEDTKKFLDFCGDIDESIKIVHVAGTNGKGSVCSFVANILKDAGINVFMFSSPHILKINERFKYNLKDISDEDFLEMFKTVFYKVLDYEKKYDENYFPSYFEYLFFMAIEYIKELKVDAIVMETGLGGRLDSTNVLRNKNVCAITSIGLDHMKYLGDTRSKIAWEKAGIIQDGVPIVFFDKDKDVTDVIENCAREKKSKIIRIDKDQISNVKINDEDNQIDFCYKSEYYNYVDLALKTRALYQIQNAAAAVSIAEELMLGGMNISRESIYRGLKNTFWTCRMEEVETGFFIDGAHNIDGIDAFLESVKSIRCKGKRILIFGVVDDKQYDDMAKRLINTNLFDYIFVTTLETQRSVDIDTLKNIFKTDNSDINISFYRSAHQSFDAAKKMKTEEDLIFCAGSLYLAGQIVGEFV